MITRNFTLYLNAGHAVPLVINVNQYDVGEQWVFSLIDGNGVKYTPSTGAIVGIKSDGLGIINSGSVNADGDVVINETQQMTAAVGKNTYELLIDDQTHGTANFIVLVEPKPGDQADFSESDLSLLQQAIDGTSATAIAQGVSEWMDDNLTPTTPVVDSSLTVSGAAADAKKTGDEISDLKSQIAQGTGLKDSIKQALLNIALNVYYKNDDGQEYYDALYSALYDVELLSITASFAQGDNLIFTLDTLNDLKQYLTVTANYDNGESEEVTTYTLSGSLIAGESTITVSYGNKTATFMVTVTEGTNIAPALSSYVASNGSYKTVSGDSIRVYTNDARTYTASQAPITRESGYSYKLSFDVQYTRGTGRGGFRNTSGSSIIKSTGNITESGHFECTMKPSDTSVNNNLYVSLFCTMGTSEIGDLTYSNIKVIKYMESE